MSKQSNEKLIKLIQAGIDVKDNYEQLYKQNHGFIYLVISKRVHGIYEIDDLKQSAFLALVQAVKRYDITRPLEESNFLQILKFCIWNELRNTDLPAHMVEKVIKYNKTFNNLYTILNRKPTDNEIALKMEIELKNLDTIKAAKRMRYKLSLDEPIGEDGSITRMDLYADSQADEEDSFENTENTIDNINLKVILDEALDKLPEKAQEIIKNRYYKNKTMEQCGNEMDVTRERVRQIESKGFRKLRQDHELRRKVYGHLNEYKHVGVNQFNNTWTSSTEWLVLKREKIREREMKINECK